MGGVGEGRRCAEGTDLHGESAAVDQRANVCEFGHGTERECYASGESCCHVYS